MSFREVLLRGDGALFLEDVEVAELALEFDTPLYVYSRNALRERALRLERAFGSAPHLVAYAIKSNMNLAVVRTFVEAGCGIDVTSVGELERALLSDDYEAAAIPDHFQSLDRHEREYIEWVLAQCDGNISQTARRLGLHRQSLQRKLRKFTPPG